LFQPENSLPTTSWYDDIEDNELLMYIPILEALAHVDDVRQYLAMFVKENKVHFTKAA
jgi:TFIIF-interacting CTD phosphatase-like protein